MLASKSSVVRIAVCESTFKARVDRVSIASGFDVDSDGDNYRGDIAIAHRPRIETTVLKDNLLVSVSEWKVNAALCRIRILPYSVPDQ